MISNVSGCHSSWVALRTPEKNAKQLATLLWMQSPWLQARRRSWWWGCLGDRDADERCQLDNGLSRKASVAKGWEVEEMAKFGRCNDYNVLQGVPSCDTE